MSDIPPTTQTERTDREHLKLLAIFHYVIGAMMIAFASLFIFHVVFGIALALNPELLDTPNDKGPPFPAFFGYFLAAFAGLVVLTGWTIGGMTIYSGRCLHNHRRRLFSLVMAGIMCIWVPFGTVLGVFTILVLCRDSVQRLYGE